MIFQKKSVCRNCGFENVVKNQQIMIKNVSYIALSFTCWNCSAYVQFIGTELEMLTNKKARL